MENVLGQSGLDERSGDGIFPGTDVFKRGGIYWSKNKYDFLDKEFVFRYDIWISIRPIGFSERPMDLKQGGLVLKI